MCVKKLILTLLILLPSAAWAQYKDTEAKEAQDSTLVLTLEDAIKIALSENTSVKVADMEITRQKYARKGSYGALFPQISASASFQHTLKKQRMYMGGSSSGGSGGGMASMLGSAFEPYNYYIAEFLKKHPDIQPYQAAPVEETEESSGDSGFEVGRKNTWNAGINASMPLVNFQLWESLCITGDQVELAVEQARESRLGTVTQVKQAYYAVLLSKASYDVYNAVYENAIQNLKFTESKYNVKKASDLDLARAQSSVAAAIPNLYNADNSITLALWQLKAVMGLDLDRDIDIVGTLEDYAETMFYDINEGSDASLDKNTQLRQLAAQAEMLSKQIKMQQDAYIPTLSVNFAYSYNAMAEDFVFKNYQWTPYSYVGLSLSIPIFSGGTRYHQVKQARVQAGQLDIQRENTERQIRIGIRQSLSTMDTAMKTYDAAKEALTSAEKAYNIASRSFEVGKSTLTDLNNTELTLTQTRLQTVQAIYNFIVAKASLEQTLGYDYTEEKTYE
ncbi:MAG: TolC family protein [Bacteroidales bacterium]|nr:TolC family protein [Bacteroidales bacterium]